LRYLLPTFLLAACTGDRDTTIDITHDPCDGITLRASPATDDRVAGIDDAIGLWAGFTTAMTRVEDRPTIEVVFESSSLAVRGLYDDELGVIHINDQLAGDPLSIVIAHELGHAFGLEHVEGRPSVMNKGNLATPPNDDDLAALEALWGRCEPQVEN
jgi:hypothetical protein